MRTLLTLLLVLVLATTRSALADPSEEYLLSPGDTIRISVFQSPEMTTETRVSGTGRVSVPLLGSTVLGGLSVPAAEARIVKELRDKGFMNNPSVWIMLVEARGSQVSVLGHVTKPGRYPLDLPRLKLTDLLSAAGGISETGGDSVLITGVRSGQPYRQEVSLSSIFATKEATADPILAPGDMVYVRKAPVFYVYGEVQKAGTYRVDPNMTVMQAVAAGGGMTPRGTIKGLRVYRRDASGQVSMKELPPDAPVQENDVVQVREALF